MSRDVRFLVSAAGHAFTAQVGDVVSMPDEEAAKWADGDRAVYDEDPRRRRLMPIEQAVAGERETAVTRSPGPTRPARQTRRRR